MLSIKPTPPVIKAKKKNNKLYINIEIIFYAKTTE